MDIWSSCWWFLVSMSYFRILYRNYEIDLYGVFVFFCISSPFVSLLLIAWYFSTEWMSYKGHIWISFRVSFYQLELDRGKIKFPRGVKYGCLILLFRMNAISRALEFHIKYQVIMSHTQKISHCFETSWSTISVTNLLTNMKYAILIHCKLPSVSCSLLYPNYKK